RRDRTSVLAVGRRYGRGNLTGRQRRGEKEPVLLEVSAHGPPRQTAGGIALEVDRGPAETMAAGPRGDRLDRRRHLSFALRHRDIDRRQQQLEYGGGVVAEQPVAGPRVALG